MHDLSAERTLVCHARTPLVFDPVEERIERAQALENDGVVDNVVVRSWPETVRLDDDGPHREVVEEFRRFEEWAERQGASVRPPFETRTRSSILEDEGVDVLVTPVLCLALYRDEQLVAVFPHSADGETHTVERALERLETGEVLRPLDRGAGDPETVACPECAATLLNGQGLYACLDCGWTGTRSPEGHTVPDAVEPTADAPATTEE